MSKFRPQEISVVVPVKNEQDNVVSLIAEIDAALSKVKHQIIYVNDGSTDATLSTLKQLQKKYKQLRVISHQQSCGQSTAVRTGVRFARYDWVATLDGDGQNNPADIPKLIDAVSEGVELVGGNRRKNWRVQVVVILDPVDRYAVLRDLGEIQRNRSRHQTRD